MDKNMMKWMGMYAYLNKLRTPIEVIQNRIYKINKILSILNEI